MPDRRQIGGLNNKRGNRYEEQFVVFKLLEHAHRLYLDRADWSKFKEQAGCPVDDLLIVDRVGRHYYQLKCSLSITWGKDAGKLKLEFEEQAASCRGEAVPFDLTVVVAHEARERSLTRHRPHSLREVARVLLFPHLTRLTEMPGRVSGVRDYLNTVAARQSESATDHEHLLWAFLNGWSDTEPDVDGFCNLATFLGRIVQMEIGRLRHDWDPQHAQWAACSRALERIPGFEFTVERGYFEWSAGATDRGISERPCSSHRFSRFIQTVLAKNPKTFEELEDFLP